MELDRPTKQLIEKYRRQFEHKNSADEEAIKELFKIFPDNKDYKGVLHEYLSRTGDFCRRDAAH